MLKLNIYVEKLTLFSDNWLRVDLFHKCEKEERVPYCPANIIFHRVCGLVAYFIMGRFILPEFRRFPMVNKNYERACRGFCFSGG